MINKVIVKAPAKINFFLDILNRRDDGYHNVNMVMQSVTLFDTVILKRAQGSEILLSVPNQRFLSYKNNVSKNTAFIAAQEFFKFTGLAGSGVKITIFKNIPICAGLAGGSADAAAVLVGLNELFNTKLSKADLFKIGKNIGADVPFCIFGGTMLATEVGTKLTSLNHIPFCYFVLCKPKFKISTQKAYEASDNCVREKKSLNGILRAIRQKKLSRLASSTFNSFEEVIELDEIQRIKSIMQHNGALSACMSGSGPTVYGIFKNKNLALECQKVLREKYKDVFICQPQKFGSKIISVE